MRLLTAEFTSRVDHAETAAAAFDTPADQAPAYAPR